MPQSVGTSKTKVIHIHGHHGHTHTPESANGGASFVASKVPSDMPVEKTTSSTHRRVGHKRTKKFKDALKNFDTMTSRVLTAYMAFRNPEKRKREYLIPKDKAAWLEFLVTVAKKRINIEYLTDKELKKVIIRARPNLSRYKKVQGPVVDPDLPVCITWNEEEVGDWVASNGWPDLKETFVKNCITGRRLILIDCSALNKMGMTDLSSMRQVAGKIRELLGIPPPNEMRALMRVSPYELFLRRKMFNGRGYDELTFEKFCEQEGYNYEIIRGNKNAQIPCTTEVLITTPEHVEDEDEGEDRESDDQSLRNAPTVEFLVRNALIRNQKVEDIMRDILESVFLPPRERKYGKEMWGSLKRGIGEGYDDLHLHYPKDKLEFASGVAHALLEELFRTVEVMNDISQLEQHVKKDMTHEELELFRKCAQILVDDAAPIVGLLALGELDLESIFKQEPEFQKYVDGIVHETEEKTNKFVPEAMSLIDEVIEEAFQRLPNMDLSGLTAEQRMSILRMANGMLKGMNEVEAEAEAEETKPVLSRSKSISGPKKMVSAVSKNKPAGKRKTDPNPPTLAQAGKTAGLQPTSSVARRKSIAKRKSVASANASRSATGSATKSKMMDKSERSLDDGAR